jgi:cysteine sulfinate desulfinase/cysteine desulfurase-like protein
MISSTAACHSPRSSAAPTLQQQQQQQQQAINELHVSLAREEPKKGATPKPPLVIPNR